MPTSTVRRLWHRFHIEKLQKEGPVIPTMVFLPEEVQRQRNEDPRLSVLALIDTGAERTCIDFDIATKLKLSAIDRITAIGAHGVEETDIYSVSFSFPDHKIEFLDWNVIGARLKTAGFSILIGRDVLRLSLLVYDGATGDVGLEFPSFLHPLENGKLFKNSGRAEPSKRRSKPKTKKRERARSRKKK